MKGFIEFINEAYTPEMKAIFNSAQLKQIGDYFARQGVSVQKSEFKHFTKKTFKPSIAAEHGWAVAKTTDNMWMIFEFKNRMVYNVAEKEDGARYFSTVKEAIGVCTDFFVFEDKSELGSLRKDRYKSQMRNDKLADKAAYIEQKARLTNDYTKKLKNELKACGYEMDWPYLVEYSEKPGKYFLIFGVSCTDREYSCQMYARTELRWGVGGKTVDQITASLKNGFTFSTVGRTCDNISELEKHIAGFERAKKAYEICSAIEADKLPTITYAEWEMMRK